MYFLRSIILALITFLGCFTRLAIFPSLIKSNSIIFYFTSILLYWPHHYFFSIETSGVNVFGSCNFFSMRGSECSKFFLNANFFYSSNFFCALLMSNSYWKFDVEPIYLIYCFRHEKFFSTVQRCTNVGIYFQPPKLVSTSSNKIWSTNILVL